MLRIVRSVVVIGVLVAGAVMVPSAAHAAGGGHWGGYVYPAPATAVRASWSVPAVTCNSTQDRFSQWVGLDGYGSSTVEQIGTRVTCENGAPHYSAFSQMYPDGVIFYEAANTPVYPGDVIDAQVTYRNGYFRQVVDETQGWTITANAGGGARQNASAEVVVEAPTHSYADFGQADFWAASANGQPFSSLPVQAVTAGNGDGPQAGPGALSNSSFSVFYYQET